MNGLRRAAAILTAAVALIFTLAQPAPAGPPPPPRPPLDIVVKIDLADGYTLGGALAGLAVTVQSRALASRGVYLVQPIDPRVASDPGRVGDLAKRISRIRGVSYAEVDAPIQLADTQFHSWPYGRPHGRNTPSQFFSQPAALALGLKAAHLVSRGLGVTVAVLDTGADPLQPVLSGRLVPGWNYVDDNADTDDVAQHIDDDGNQIVDSALGHGTFVSGLVALVAPEARIMPLRVLDSDGYGYDFAVAQAILDAISAGATVLNLSFGSPVDVHSKLLDDALNTAKQNGVIVVAAAGNDGDDHPHFPAASASVIGVGAMNTTGLASFSDFGGWVKLTAPGQDVVGPLPGNQFATWSGTSMAAPLVAGQIALVRAEVPTLAIDKITNVVTSTAGHVAHAGHGMINIPASLAVALNKH